MKTLATAQAEFRFNDRDGNRKQDFWREDVAGLYALESGSHAIKLIDIAVAGADARPSVDIDRVTVRSPRSGYWYRALRFADEKGAPDPGRWAACAYPDAYQASGHFTFIVDHRNTVYKKDLGHGDGLEVYPDDPEAEGWIALR